MGPYQAPAQITVVAGVTHPSTTTIQYVDFYQGSTELGSTTQAPYNVRLPARIPELIRLRQLLMIPPGRPATATTQIQVLESNHYNRGWWNKSNVFVVNCCGGFESELRWTESLILRQSTRQSGIRFIRGFCGRSLKTTSLGNTSFRLAAP